MKSTADILREARALIDTPEKWTKGTFARNANGNVCSWLSRSARCFCASGAIMRVENAQNPALLDTWQTLRLAMGRRTVSEVNDAPESSHADVLAAFDRAIALAETQA